MKKLAAKIFRPSTSGVASVILALASLLSYILGLGRDILLSNYFGANELTDAYNTAFLIPDFIYTLIVAGALSGIFLPIFKSQVNQNQKSGWELAGAFLVFSQISILVISIIAFIAMPWLVSIFFSDLPVEKAALIIKLSRILLLSPIVFTISNTIGTILISFKHYLAYALSAAFYNGGIILGIFLWHDSLGIYSAVWGVALGLVLHLIIRLIDARHLESKIRLRFWHPAIKEIYLLALPKTVGLLAWQFCLWAYNIIGYTLTDGSIAAFNYARNIQSFAVSLFGISIATAIFPFLVDLRSEQKTTELRSKIENTLIQVWLYTLPAAVGLALLANDTVDVLLGRGAFDSTAINLTGITLLFFAFSIPFESLNHVMARAYYAFQNVIIPVVISLIFMAINMIGSYFFAQRFGPQTFSLFFTIATFVQISISATIFHHKYIKFRLGYLASNFFKIALGCCLMGIVVYVLKTNISNVLIRFGLCVSLGALVYGLWLIPSKLFKYTGSQRVLTSIGKLFGKNS